MTGALGKDLAPSPDPDTGLSLYFAWPFTVQSMEASLRCILTNNSCRSLYATFVQEISTRREAVSCPFLEMGDLWLVDLKLSAQVQWGQSKANRSHPLDHWNNRYNHYQPQPEEQFLLFGFQLLSSFLTQSHSAVPIKKKPNGFT